MKILIALLGLFIGTIHLASAQKTANTSTDTIATLIYCDHCAQCETCRFGLDASLYKVKGVKNVVIDAARQQIIVSYNPARTSLAAIEQAINNAGYDANEQKATEEAVGKLDGCCRKQ